MAEEIVSSLEGLNLHCTAELPRVLLKIRYSYYIPQTNGMRIAGGGTQTSVCSEVPQAILMGSQG